MCLRGIGTFARLHTRVFNTGSLMLAAFEGRMSGLKIRSSVALDLGANHLDVWRVLKNNNQHAFQRVHDVLPGDLGSRFEFCQWMVDKVEEDANFLAKILFTDECSFSRTGDFLISITSTFGQWLINYYTPNCSLFCLGRYIFILKALLRAKTIHVSCLNTNQSLISINLPVPLLFALERDGGNGRRVRACSLMTYRGKQHFFNSPNLLIFLSYVFFNVFKIKNWYDFRDLDSILDMPLNGSPGFL